MILSSPLETPLTWYSVASVVGGNGIPLVCVVLFCSSHFTSHTKTDTVYSIRNYLSSCVGSVTFPKSVESFKIVNCVPALCDVTTIWNISCLYMTLKTGHSMLSQHFCSDHRQQARN